MKLWIFVLGKDGEKVCVENNDPNAADDSSGLTGEKNGILMFENFLLKNFITFQEILA